MPHIEGFYDDAADADRYIDHCISLYDEVAPNRSLLIDVRYSSLERERIHRLSTRGKPWFARWRWHPLLIDEDVDDELSSDDADVIRFWFIPSRRIALRGSCLFREQLRAQKIAARYGVEFRGIVACDRQDEVVANPRMIQG